MRDLGTAHSIKGCIATISIRESPHPDHHAEDYLNVVVSQMLPRDFLMATEILLVSPRFRGVVQVLAYTFFLEANSFDVFFSSP